MGAKFYRGSDKAKKIRKRLTQTRSWVRQLVWLACKPYPSPYNSLFSRAQTSLTPRWWPATR